MLMRLPRKNSAADCADAPEGRAVAAAHSTAIQRAIVAGRMTFPPCAARVPSRALEFFYLSSVGSSTILPRHLAGFRQPMRLGRLRQRHDPLDLRLDLAFRRGRKAFRQVGRIVAGPAADGDLLVIEVRHIDRHVRSAMRARGHQPSAEAERHERERQHLRIGDVVVDHVDALAAGELQHLVLDVVGVVVDGVVGAERAAERAAVVGAGRRDHGRAGDVLRKLDADAAEIAAGAHDQHGLALLQLGDVEQQIPGRRHVAHHHRRVAEIEARRHIDRGAGGDADQLGEAALPLDAHHAFRDRCSRSSPPGRRRAACRRRPRPVRRPCGG